MRHVRTSAVLLLLLIASVAVMDVLGGATGRVIVPKKGSSSGRKKLTFTFLVRSFFTTLVDPTSYTQNAGSLSFDGSAVGTTTLKAKGGKGKKYKLGGATANVFGEGGATIGGGSFGPVCGPNGCH